jgi:aldose 1-epimerase
MRQWPYAHTIDMTYRLAGGVLDVSTTIANLSDEPMPVSIGFHPYFQLTDSPRDEWTIAVGASTRWLLDARKLPTGATEPATLFQAARSFATASTRCSATSSGTARGNRR